MSSLGLDQFGDELAEALVQGAGILAGSQSFAGLFCSLGANASCSDGTD